MRQFSHRFQFQGVHLSPLGFAACQSKKSTNQANSGASHRFHRFHRTACWGCSPTEYAEFTEALAEWSLPQISQIYTDAANFRGCTCLKCTNQARSAPTKQTVVLPQIAQIYTELLVGDVLPQIAQNSQKFLLNGSPTDFTDLHRSC